MTLDERRDSILRDMNAIFDRLEALPEAAWKATTPCKGWNVRHLAAHLTGTIPLMEGRLAAIVEQRSGKPQPTSELPELGPETPRDELVAGLRERGDALASRLASLTEEDVTTALPGPGGFLAQTADLYLTLAASEFAIHLNDLEVALGNDNAPVSPQGVVAIDAIMGSHLAEFAGMAGNTPAMPLSIGLRGSTLKRDLTWNGESWTNTAWLNGGQTLVSGSDEAISRFIFGRITIDHPLLRVEGDADLAGQFKTYVPGP
ncbi:MAG: hypothetical protein AVDCRST_MAG87-3735 [uncultured Thermomicrobiales bacterium]|uniref:Mycothiol-dependent maleylpyruvate isomerase metal-binding domain-containing protein n=1 Tax=uncultured Thermomicrobiales bacterium TaxID=1645740 RepID=A0A6J4VT17_9BACT|nr:MAG: hypothetical protein AVDCRST_MAG87-3735 [uncultured Thermomicrobiales bacterium]